MPNPKNGDVYTCGNYEYKYYMIERNGGPVAMPMDYANGGTVCCFEGVNFTKQKITFSGNKKMIDWLMATVNVKT